MKDVNALRCAHNSVQSQSIGNIEIFHQKILNELEKKKNVFPFRFFRLRNRSSATFLLFCFSFHAKQKKTFLLVACDFSNCCFHVFLIPSRKEKKKTINSKERERKKKFKEETDTVISHGYHQRINTYTKRGWQRKKRKKRWQFSQPFSLLSKVCIIQERKW